MAEPRALVVRTMPAYKFGATCCNEHPVTIRRAMGGAYATHRHEGRKEVGKCTRPVWGDGHVDGKYYGLCALCWFNWCAFHGAYRLFQMNAAAAYVDIKSAATLEALFIESRTDPRKAAAVPASFLEALWGDDDPLPDFPEPEEQEYA